MTEFVGPIHKHIEDLFILDVEALCYLADKLKHHIPDSLSESKFHAALDSIIEESANGLVIRETSGDGEKIVLHGCDGSHGNLRGEVPHLVLSESEVLFAVLKDDLQGPTHGVDPVGFQEVNLSVGGNQPVPLAPFVALAEEQADIASGKGHVHGDMVTAKATAVITALLWLVEKSCELIGGISLAFICVLRLAHLDHSEIMALHMTGCDEPDDVSAGEPTVSQDVIEMYPLLDDTTDHLDHQRDLALVVFPDALGCIGIPGMFLGEACVELLPFQAIVLLPSLLADESEVYQHLAPAVGDAKEEGLEAEHHGMGDMGEHLADKLRLDAALGIVRVVNHQAYRLCGPARPLLLRLAPELPGNGGEYLAPVIIIPRKETIERVALAAEQAAQ